VPVILIDANVEGHVAVIRARLQSAAWHELTIALDVTFQTLRQVGPEPVVSDAVVWRFCQEHSHYLLTGNRNADSEDSLEVTLRREGSAISLPVFTLSTPDRVYHDVAYLERVVEKLLEHILCADNILGAGRVYLP